MELAAQVVLDYSSFEPPVSVRDRIMHMWSSYRDIKRQRRVSILPVRQTCNQTWLTVVGHYTPKE